MEKFKTNSGLTVDQIHEWVESLKLKNKGLYTNINNQVLFEAMGALLIIKEINNSDFKKDMDKIRDWIDDGELTNSIPKGAIKSLWQKINKAIKK